MHRFLGLHDPSSSYSQFYVNAHYFHYFMALVYYPFDNDNVAHVNHFHNCMAHVHYLHNEHRVHTNLFHNHMAHAHHFHDCIVLAYHLHIYIWHM